MANFDSKAFNPQAFGAYVKQIPNTTKTELANCKAIGSNEQAASALSTQTGSLYTRVPYFGRINGSTSQNNNGASDINTTATTTYEQGFVTASRMDGWTEKSFSKSITAGVNFMDNVAAQVGDYKLEVKQAILLAMLEGAYAMTITGTTVPAKAAKEFVEKHTYDITAIDDGMVQADSLNKAIQRAGGDNKNIFKLAIMHSEISTNLENLKLLKYMTYNDGDGIERELAMATWNGRTVLIDDNMPTADVAASGDVDAYTAYTTYLLGEGAVILDEIGDENPYEMYRDPKVNGGQDTLYVRDRFICGIDGISFEKPASITASASNTDLETGTNWNIINDGTTAIPHKAISICRIISKG